MRNTPVAGGTIGNPATCGRKKRAATIVRHAHAQCKARDLGVVPLNRKSDGSAAYHTEVIAVVSVLPNVFTTHNQVPCQSLLKPRVKFIAVARTNRSRVTGDARRRN